MLLAQIMVILDVSVVNVALPSIGADLRFSSGDYQWLISAYVLLSGGLLLLGGRLADLFRRRSVVLTGPGLFTTASLISGLSAGAVQLIVARAAQGAGAALLTPAALSIIMTNYSGKQRAAALSVWGAIGSSGIAIGVLLGGILTSSLGWQAVFFINVPIGIAVLVGALRALPAGARPGRVRGRLDVPGPSAWSPDCWFSSSRSRGPASTGGPPAGRSSFSAWPRRCSPRSPSSSGRPRRRWSPPIPGRCAPSSRPPR
jgi:MFS family permease